MCVCVSSVYLNYVAISLVLGLHERVFDAYEKLAGFFQSSQDYKTAVYFYEKCLDIAESMEDLSQQGNSNLHLGLTHDLMGQTKLAIQVSNAKQCLLPLH